MTAIANKNIFRYRILLFVFLGLFFFWNLYSLSLSPIPWEDEVYFASVADSFLHGEGFTQPVGLDQDVFHYGPIYFAMTGLSIWIGGLNPFSFRLVSLIFAFLSGFIIFKILRGRNCGYLISFLAVTAFLIDPLTIFCAHNGRMDIVCAFFILCGILCYEKYANTRRARYLISLSIFFLCSSLTSLRSVVVFVPIYCIIFVNLIKDRRWLPLLLIFFIPLLGHLLWIFCSYGSLSNFYDYFVGSNGQNDGNFISRFVGFSLNIESNHYPLLVAFIFSIVYSIKKKFFGQVCHYFVTILIFYLTVHSTAECYSIMIFPFYYIVIADCLSRIKKCNEKKVIFLCSWMLASIILIINLGSFGVKLLMIESSKQYRDAKLVTSWVKNNIPPHSRVLGTYQYYYALKDNDCEFKVPEQLYEDEEKSLSYIYDYYRPVYLLVEKNITSPLDMAIISSIKKEQIAEYSIEPSMSLISTLFKKIGLENKSSYEGTLYKIMY